MKAVFTIYRDEMKGVEWGLLYNEFGNQYPDTEKIEAEVKRLMMDEDITCKKGIYEYILSRREKVLSIRAFSANQKREAYEKQGYRCPYCKADGVNKTWQLEEMEADHITPWHEGGRTIAENCRMLCKAHNRQKGGK